MILEGSFYHEDGLFEWNHMNCNRFSSLGKLWLPRCEHTESCVAVHFQHMNFLANTRTSVNGARPCFLCNNNYSDTMCMDKSQREITLRIKYLSTFTNEE